jgi:peptide/nickel transport system permease protein
MNSIAKFGLAVAAVLVLMAALSPLLTSWERVQSQDLVSRLDSPDRGHLMGRDQLGRDELARIIYGARVSMPSASVVIHLLDRRRVDRCSPYAGMDRRITGFLFNVFLSFPIPLPLLWSRFGPSLKNLHSALGDRLVGARLMRASARVREYDFVTARAWR